MSCTITPITPRSPNSELSVDDSIDHIKLINLDNFNKIAHQLAEISLSLAFASWILIPRNESNTIICHIFARIIGAVGVAICIPILIIEGIVRLALGAIAFLFCKRDFAEGQFKSGLVGMMMSGSLAIIFVKNVYRPQITIDDFLDFICFQIE